MSVYIDVLYIAFTVSKKFYCVYSYNLLIFLIKLVVLLDINGYTYLRNEIIVIYPIESLTLYLPHITNYSDLLLTFWNLLDRCSLYREYLLYFTEAPFFSTK